MTQRQCRAYEVAVNNIWRNQIYQFSSGTKDFCTLPGRLDRKIELSFVDDRPSPNPFTDFCALARWQCNMNFKRRAALTPSLATPPRGPHQPFSQRAELELLTSISLAMLRDPARVSSER